MAEAYLNRGSAYREKGEYDKAIAEHTEAIRIDPNFAKAYLDRGRDYSVEKGEFGKAFADWTEVIRIDPNNAQAYYLRGIVYGGIGEKAKAAADFAKAKQLGLDP